MAAKPIERFVKRQIADQGGWPRILERIASGETVADISRTLLRQPGGPCISRAFLSRLLHHDPERSSLVRQAHLDGAAAMVDDALHGVDRSPIDRDSINKAKVQADVRLKVAGLIDRGSWGEAKQAVNFNLQVGSLHVDALRHRTLPSNTVPNTSNQLLAGTSGGDLRGSPGPGPAPSGIDAEVIASQARGTQDLALTTLSNDSGGPA